MIYAILGLLKARRGMIMKTAARTLVFTGDGKGKTTAAMGMAFRAVGHGMAVFIIQFCKSDATTGELHTAATIPGVEFVQSGCGFIPPDAPDSAMESHRQAAQSGLRRAMQAVISGVYPVVILDEICYAVHRGLLDEQSVIDLIHAAREDQCIVMTGRGATKGLIDAADTVTEMKCIKHGMNEGIEAQRGIEF